MLSLLQIAWKISRGITNICSRSYAGNRYLWCPIRWKFLFSIYHFQHVAFSNFALFSYKWRNLWCCLNKTSLAVLLLTLQNYIGVQLLLICIHYQSFVMLRFVFEQSLRVISLPLKVRIRRRRLQFFWPKDMLPKFLCFLHRVIFTGLFLFILFPPA